MLFLIKNIIFVNCGIEISNYQKALDLIKQQIEDMKQGDFTEEDIDNAILEFQKRNRKFGGK